MQITVDLELDDVTFEAEFYVSRYDPGKTYGPAEDCYPPEGGPEIEWLAVTVFDGLGAHGSQRFECDPANFPYAVEQLAELAYDEYLERTGMRAEW
jgi:hypothetical protein